MEAGKDPWRSFRPTCVPHLVQYLGSEPGVWHQAQGKFVARTKRNQVSVLFGRKKEIERRYAVLPVAGCSGPLVTNLDTTFFYTTHGAVEQHQIS